MSKNYNYYRNVLISMAILFLVALFFAFCYRIYRSTSYEKAKELIVCEDYTEAESRFEKLGDYRDCTSYLSLLSAIEDIKQNKYEDAITILKSFDNFEPARDWLFEAEYKYAQYLYDCENFSQANNILAQLWTEAGAEDRKDIEEWLYKSKFAYAQQLYAAKDFSNAVSLFSELEGYSEVEDWLHKSKYAYGQQLYMQMDYSSAITLFEGLDDFSDSKNWLNRSMYALALELNAQNDVLAALNYFLELGNYEKSAQYVEEILASDIEIDTDVLYKAACRHFDAELYWRALSEFQSLNGYSDSERYVDEIIKKIRQSLSTTVSVGQKYTVAVDYEGKALTTGFDPNGRSNVNNDNWTELISISGFSDVTAGLKSDGTVITTSRNLNNEIERANSSWQSADIVAISVGNAYIVGLDSDGTLKSAGHDAGDGQREVDDWTDIVAIATGWRHTAGLNSAGDVLITGYGSSRQFNQIQSNKEDWRDIIAIAAGGGDDVGKGHTVGLREDGKVFAVGDNEFNQCEVSQWKDIIAIAAGDWFTMGLDKDGQIFITKPGQDVIDKYNLYTDVLRVEGWSNTGVIAIAAGGGSAIGLYSDGDVIAAGYSQYDQREAANSWSNIMVYN